MKKTYQSPVMNIVKVISNRHLLTESVGLTSGAKVGNDYTSTDVSYSRSNNADLWDDDDEE